MREGTPRNRLDLFFSQFTRVRFTLIFVHTKVLLNVLSDFRLHLVMQNGPILGGETGHPLLLFLVFAEKEL